MQIILIFASILHVFKVVAKSKMIRDLLLGVVTTNVLFSSYASDEHNAIVDAFEMKEVDADQYVIKQGDSGDHFYVVQTGSLDIFVKSKEGESTKVNSPLGPGSCFGELALMYNTPRAASIKSSTKSVLWEIDRTSYRGILTYYKYIRNQQYLEFLKKVRISDKELGSLLTESKRKYNNICRTDI